MNTKIEENTIIKKHWEQAILSDFIVIVNK